MARPAAAARATAAASTTDIPVITRNNPKAAKGNANDSATPPAIAVSRCASTPWPATATPPLKPIANNKYSDIILAAASGTDNSDRANASANPSTKHCEVIQQSAAFHYSCINP